MNTAKPLVRRERRFEVGDLTGFDAIVRRAGSDEAEYFAELIDFSRAGVKFSLPFCARFDESLDIRFEFKHSKLKYAGQGRVRHIRTISNKRWLVGCSIDPELTEEVISYLAKRTNQERRRYHRIDVDGSGELVRQGTIEGCTAHVINISEGGFCLLADEQQELGQRLDFRIQNKLGEVESIAARVRWQNELDGRFRIGCGYANSEAYEKLIDCLSFQDDYREGDEKISWFVATVAMLAMFLPPVCFFLLDNTGDQPAGNHGAASAPPVVADSNPDSAEVPGSATPRHSARRRSGNSAESAVPATEVAGENAMEVAVDVDYPTEFHHPPDVSVAAAEPPKTSGAARPTLTPPLKAMEQSDQTDLQWPAATDSHLSLVPPEVIQDGYGNVPQAVAGLAVSRSSDQPPVSGSSAVPDPLQIGLGNERESSVELPVEWRAPSSGKPGRRKLADRYPAPNSSRRDPPTASPSTSTRPSRSISFDRPNQSIPTELDSQPGRTDTDRYQSGSSSRRKRENRILVVPSEVIRKKQMSDLE